MQQRHGNPWALEHAWLRRAAPETVAIYLSLLAYLPGVPARHRALLVATCEARLRRR
jgi:hypothetical protein